MSKPLRTCRICGKEAHIFDELDLFVTSNNGSKYNKLRLCKECQIKDRKKYLKTEKGARRRRQSRNRYDDRTRIKILTKLHDPIECKHCFMDDIRLLCIDHIHDNGNTERRKLSSNQIQRKILKMSAEDARKEYQLLCRNCNWLKMHDLYFKNR